MNKINNVINSYLLSFNRNLRYLNPFSKNIGYIGWLGKGNLGDEVMYLAFRKMFPRFNIVPFKYTPKTEIFEEIFRKKLFDAIFLGGGTLINNRGCLEEFKIAQEKYSTTFIFGTGVRNPLFWDKIDLRNNCLNEWVESLNKCKYVSVRGPVSRHILNCSGFYNLEVTGDPALFLANAAIKQKERKKRLGINIGVSKGYVWGNENEILNFIVNLAKVVISDGWEVTFLPVFGGDIPYIEEAIKRTGINIPIFYEFNSLKKTMNFLEKCDMFIGEKLHSVILAMCAYTPSIMLGYRPKCLDFMTSMELEKFHVRTDELSLDKLIDLMRELLDNTEYFQNKIAQKVTYYKQLQKKTSQHITELIVNT